MLLLSYVVASLLACCPVYNAHINRATDKLATTYAQYAQISQDRYIEFLYERDRRSQQIAGADPTTAELERMEQELRAARYTSDNFVDN